MQNRRYKQQSHNRCAFASLLTASPNGLFAISPPLSLAFPQCLHVLSSFLHKLHLRESVRFFSLTLKETESEELIMGESLSELFEHPDASPEDLFSILEAFEDAVSRDMAPFDGRQQRSGHEDDEKAGKALKKRKLSDAPGAQTEQPKTSHISVERNRRKQMNEQLSVLRSLMPFFYAKRGDQATIIGGAVEYIKELQQVLQSLEAKKQRKAYGEVVLSPRPVPSPRPPHWSPRPPPLSPRMALPIGPRTPQPGSPYMPRMQQNYAPPTVPPSHESSPSFGSSASELTANSNSAVAEVEVKFSGPNVILKTVSHRIRGQVLKIVAALEGLALEILHVSISITDDTMLNSFTIKIGIECELSAEELAHEIQQTFS